MDRLTEHEAFLRAIFDCPEDGLPRLVYADFLEENGDPDRAALIRVQCERAALVRRGETAGLAGLQVRETELLDYLHPELRDWPSGAPIPYDRGFLTEGRAVICPGELDDIDSCREKIIRSRPHWFGANTLSITPGWFLYPEHIDKLFGLAAVQRIADWDLGALVDETPAGPETEDAGTFALIDMDVQPVITVEGVETLAQHRGARRIVSLDLTYNNLDNDAARALIRSPYLINLQRLDYREGNELRGRMWQQLLERFGGNVVG
jgi:uncharacterized protein (TIGR02996 family)